ncbi:quinolinate synthase NadA [Nitratidesulfovibrio sp. HK-II]|uniref:quinolinate synthase NadA n=1 Tax=Nitratidesulfovibrio sp. HK-II TaxID=2009266 RepID=UPI000E2EA824|nr:quinolinate synthase NadA [Nitratidesulfovibrio sp. HK-II]GBO95771.1 quinolinate synthetase [Nitratidesulfovibrio sp. HK-II]
MTAQPSQKERIAALRAALGPNLTIMGHHYQHESVIRHTDLRGDSLELARRVATTDAASIVFCGVYFMAESAALLARPGQKVYLPEHSANCVMAQMAPAERVDAVLRALQADGRKVVPLAYVNTSLAVKAVVGRHGGAVCTSANARTMLEWTRKQGDAVLFMPDKNLARNTANLLGIPDDKRHMLDVRAASFGTDVLTDEARRAELLIWPGCCAIHARFNLRQMETARAAHPGCRIVVHPECSPEVVNAADAAGSTTTIIRFADEAPDGSTVIVGTEINLVQRLARQHAGRLTVLPLLESACSHMARVTEPKLLRTLEGVAAGTETPVTVPMDLHEPAKAALQRMLDACA